MATAVAIRDEAADEMVQFSVMLSVEQKRELTRLARVRQTKMGILIREAIRAWLAGQAA